MIEKEQKRRMRNTRDEDLVKCIVKEPYFEHPYLKPPPKNGEVYEVEERFSDGTLLLKGFVGLYTANNFESWIDATS
jgi:hypothetical protein